MLNPKREKEFKETVYKITSDLTQLTIEAGIESPEIEVELTTQCKGENDRKYKLTFNRIL